MRTQRLTNRAIYATTLCGTPTGSCCWILLLFRKADPESGSCSCSAKRRCIHSTIGKTLRSHNPNLCARHIPNPYQYKYNAHTQYPIRIAMHILNPYQYKYLNHCNHDIRRWPRACIDTDIIHVYKCRPFPFPPDTPTPTHCRARSIPLFPRNCVSFCMVFGGLGFRV